MKRILLSTCVATSLLFTGCGEDTDESKAYDIELALDNGEYDKVITTLDDCSTYIGDKKLNCYLNLGAAYFGKASFDMISLSQEITSVDESLSSDEKSKKFNEIIFNKLDNTNLETGIAWYKKLLTNNNSNVCNAKDYKALNAYQKEACISLNPLLLSDLLNDQDTSSDSEVAVSLEQIIQFKNVMQDAVPELTSSDLVAIISKDKLDDAKDINNNGKLDSTEVTNYVIKVFNGKTWSDSSLTHSDVNSNNLYTKSGLENTTYVKVTVSGTSSTKDYYRVMQKIDGVDKNTSLTIIPNIACNPANETSSAYSANSINGTTILPCIKLKDDGNVTSLNDSVTNILNDDDLINSIALSSDSEDDNKNDQTKIDDFQKKMCDINGSISSSNTGNCEYSDNKLVITQDAFINYLSEDKED